ncbi:MAG: ECF transporter S component [Clostridia bacterium]|nr:ECF transporter S component [Clostridia bacterium]
MKKPNIIKLIMSALFAALTCIFTMLPIGIPSLTQGYIHFGDCFVLLSGWYLGPYGVLAAGIGSMLTDILGGYLIYAPATLIIKMLVALIATSVLKISQKDGGIKFALRLLGGIVAEVFMAIGYFIYSATVMGYGWAGSAVEIPNNLVQGGVGVVAAIILAQIIDSTHVLKKLK